MGRTKRNSNKLLRADIPRGDWFTKIMLNIHSVEQTPEAVECSSSAGRYVHQRMRESKLAKDYYMDHITVTYREAI